MDKSRTENDFGKEFPWPLFGLLSSHDPSRWVGAIGFCAQRVELPDVERSEFDICGHTVAFGNGVGEVQEDGFNRESLVLAHTRTHTHTHTHTHNSQSPLLFSSTRQLKIETVEGG